MLFKGFYDSLEDGSLEGAPDIRLALVMSGFTGESEEDSVNLADITDLDEFDGAGYARIDCANVAAGYDSTDDEWQLDFDDDSFGDPVAPGSDDIYGTLVYLYVDGTASGDIVLAFTTEGAGVNASNGAVGFTVPADGLLFVRDAAGS